MAPGERNMKEAGGGGAGRGCGCLRIFSGRGCLISLQVAVLVLAAQTIMSLSGISLHPKRLMALFGSGKGGLSVRGPRRERMTMSALEAPVVNTIFTPVCSPIEEQYAGQARPIADIAIASECGKRSRRDAIRKGWGSYAKKVRARGGR